MPICKKCSCSFPNWLVIDGRRRNLRARRYCLDCSPWGAHNSKRLDKYEMIDGVEHKKCSVCQVWISVDDYYKTRGSPMAACKRCQNQRTGDTARTIKSKAVAYKGGRCQDCQRSFADCVYDFHHIDPSQKDFSISGREVRHMTWTQIKRELDKCVLLCANCHRLRHYDRCNPDYKNHRNPS